LSTLIENDQRSPVADGTHLRYRPDLDGLRALAVLAVVGSHVSLRSFDGGYVGVDVFFVISGYLIGGILLREVGRQGRVNYVDFYERRIRRIFPALLAMLLAVAIVTYLVLLPKDLLNFAKMGTSALLFSANIYLSRSGGYFDFEAANNFLTHTWSLGVEEQFYIVLPPFLMLFRSRIANGRIRSVIAWTAAISFAISVPAVYFAPTGSFYLLPTRIWELMAGVLAYLYGPQVCRLAGRWQSVLAAIGLVAILLPIALYTRRTLFPGLSALPPCLGAALIIATGSTFVHRMLSWRVCVLIGQISYSLYLWHWPIVVYNKMYPFSPQHERLMKLGVIGLSLVIAYLSWRWIETPFRKGRFKPSRAGVFWFAGVCSAAFLAFFLLISVTNGAAYRFSPFEQQIASYRQSGGSLQHFRVGKCFIEKPTAASEPDWDACLKPDPARPNYLLLGSSLMAQLHDGLSEVYPEIHFLQATSPNCNIKDPAEAPGREGCSVLMHYIFADYLAHNKIDAVMFQVEPEDTTPEELTAAIGFFRQRGIRVYVIGSQVNYDLPGPALAIASLRDPKGFRLTDHVTDVTDEDDPHKSVAQAAGATWLSMREALCNTGACRILAAPGVPMETDQEHLTYDGTLFVARNWRSRGLLLPSSR
jgi:peptidoglycan/LPS O-acetylase OafA/YrhL